MNKDVRSNLERLMAKYEVAQAKLAVLRSTELPTGRAANRAGQQAIDAIGTLREGRKPSSHALVKLAYVRAMREVDHESRLNPDQASEVNSLAQRLDMALSEVERASLVNFHSHVRKLRIVNVAGKRGMVSGFADAIKASDKDFPLEIRARVSVLEVLEMAAAAGALAGTTAGDYDGV